MQSENSNGAGNGLQLGNLACPAGIEPATLGLEVRSGTLFNAFRFLYKPLISNEKAMKQGLTT